MAFKEVPKSVQQTVLARFKGAKVVGASAEKGDDQKLVYEVNLREKGKNIDVTLAPTGEMILIEQEISFSGLPKPAADTLGKRYPGARYKIVEMIYKVEGGKETLAYYEALLMDSSKQAWAAELAGDGAVLKIEKKKGLNEKDEE
jgi:hypothetical protein